MIQVEHDHLGSHYAFSLKSMNPGLLDASGIHFVSALHSVTPRLALGFETVIQNAGGGRPIEMSNSYVAKLTSLPNPLGAAMISTPGTAISNPFRPSWIATAQLQPSGNINTTYYHKLTDKVDVALDFQTVIQPESMMGPAKRDAVATLGAKYDFRMATFRGQIDSVGKVGMLLEQRFTPAFAFLVSGEIDHAKVSDIYQD